MIGEVTQSGGNLYYDVLGFTYDPATGKGYDIEGALVFDNGRYAPGAGYQPVGPAVPLVIDQQTGTLREKTPEEKKKEEKEKTDNTLLLVIAGAALFLIAMKR